MTSHLTGVPFSSLSLLDVDRWPYSVNRIGGVLSPCDPLLLALGALREVGKEVIEFWSPKVTYLRLGFEPADGFFAPALSSIISSLD